MRLLCMRLLCAMPFRPCNQGALQARPSATSTHVLRSDDDGSMVLSCRTCTPEQELARTQKLLAAAEDKLKRVQADLASSRDQTVELQRSLTRRA